MTKKSGRTIRSKRRPSTKHKSRRKATTVHLTGATAKGEVGTVTPAVFIDQAGQPIYAHKTNTAVQSTQGVIEPPPAAAPQGEEAHLAGGAGMRVDSIPMRAPVPITPTVYPDSSQGTVIVQNYVTINIQSEEFSRFNKNIEALFGELRRSNEISGEVRDQLLSELRAGREIITGPKPQRHLIDLLLVKPLKWLIDKSGLAIVSKLAWDALVWLLKMLAA
jgi:hypothetical protein